MHSRTNYTTEDSLIENQPGDQGLGPFDTSNQSPSGIALIHLPKAMPPSSMHQDDDLQEEVSMPSWTFTQLLRNDLLSFCSMVATATK